VSDAVRGRAGDERPAGGAPRGGRARPAGAGAATRRAAPAEAGPETTPAANRAAATLWIALVLLAAARAALTLVPTMHAWSLNLQRFLSPAWAWVPWALAALALVPPLGRAALPAVRRAGDAVGRGSWIAVLVAMVVGAGLVAALPDQVRFVGDFQLRQGTIDEAMPASEIFPQAMPLDLFLHYDLPVRIMGSGHMDANWAPRALGAVEAALLALLALAFARALALRGAAALAVAAAVFFGGTLGLFTGYAKVNGEMVLLAVAVAAGGVRAAREGRGLLTLGVALALGCTLHRSALGFVPAVALAFVLALRARPEARREPLTWIALALPVAVLALTLGRIVHTLTTFDPGMHLASDEVRLHGGVLGSMFAGARAFDLPNVVTLMAPLAPALLLVALAWGRGLPRPREAALLAALALPFVGLLLFVHPYQGAFRDYDTLSGSGVTLALLAAWLAGETLRRAPAWAWLGLAVALAAAAPSAQWLAHQADVNRGLARVKALMDEPPPRTPEDRGKTWDYVGVRNFNRENWPEAAHAFSRAAETQPSARVLVQWAMAETMLGDLRSAKDLYGRALRREPNRAVAWQGYGVVSLRLGDLDDAHRAVLELLKLDPANPETLDALRKIKVLMARRAAGLPVEYRMDQP
jgi:hypothetical protein